MVASVRLRATCRRFGFSRVAVDLDLDATVSQPGQLLWTAVVRSARFRGELFKLETLAAVEELFERYFTHIPAEELQTVG